VSPVPGAIATVVAESGENLASAFADATGTFSLPALPSGSYLLTAEIVGRRSRSVRVTLTRSDFFVLALPPDPIELAGIDVSVGRRCSKTDTPVEGITAVWNEVQKALRAAALTRTLALFEFRVRARERQRDLRTGTLYDDGTEERVVTGYDPFDSRAPEDLAARGYVVEENGDWWFYGPSVEVLLSRAFQDAHCFALRRDRDRRLIGLAFEPLPGRDRPDIEGVLWLTEETAQLQTLEFSYTRLPPGFIRGQYEGSATFRRLEGGAWAIDRWRLSAPDLSDRMRIRERTGELLEARRLP
jgi:hypothetical protein